MSKRCTICDITQDGLTGYHPRLETFETAQQRQHYLSTVTFTEDAEGNLICSECDETIQDALNEMSEADDDN